MKLKTYQLALLLLLTILIPMLTVISLSSHTRAQERQVNSTGDSKDAETVAQVCKGNHHSRKEFYDSARLFPPLTVLEIVGNRLNYSIVDQGIHLGSLELEDGYSIVPKDFSRQKHDGCYGVTYCVVHKVVLHIADVDSKQCGTIKS